VVSAKCIKTVKMMNRCSSVSIVSDCGLDDRGSIPGRGKDFSSRLCIQTDSGAHPSFYLWVLGPGCDTDD
jgi:hypothetical protein